MGELVRLQKFMAQCGVASRRKCEEIILQGRVKVNGKLVNQLGFKVDPEKDVVEVDGKRISLQRQKVYIMLNKPFGVISSAKDEKGRKTVVDLVKDKVNVRVFPVGRLDFDTTGLILLTNDGEFAYKVTHPKHDIEKTYIALIKGIPSKEEIERFEKGLLIDGKMTAPAKFKILKLINGNALVEIKIHEGRNRQIRKMCDQIGHKVLKLKRVAIGKLQLGKLKEGKFVFLDRDTANKVFEK
ncbi:pseudouridine synthase [Caldicellulosiruptor hydrothermalis 108]|uniref:Pseudouridine synthase n=1 Tax=Caldicellulosiruptor hydrothermalis (strain DSM 18901 / VKM B-2411 / 108) TaxID=632292 RepID=E4Q8Z3_CALH1|nr:pseudouridine synthase [Caldicellulosiruptor hydrothermalis]ADQ06912.1 pseudouridine synthase [Caldicellulosiruptor hydrothermalis 108]